MLRVSILLATVFWLMACQPEQVAVEVLPTYTSYPTYTPAPTATLQPTYTPYPTPTANPVASLLWPSGTQDDVIAHYDAAEFVGEQMTVEGLVLNSRNDGQVVTLDFDLDPMGFKVNIPAQAWPYFAVSPELLFYGKLVRVTGKIEGDEQQSGLTITEPWAIEAALTHGAVPECNCLTTVTTSEMVSQEPLSTPDSADSLIAPTDTSPLRQVSWQDAAAYEGNVAVVSGLVVDTYNSGNVVYLNFDADYRTTFKVVIFPDDWDNFPSPPETLYRNHQINVTGEIGSYRGAPQIIVSSPEQITIVE